MLENRSVRIGFTSLHAPIAFLRTLGVAALLGAFAVSVAQAQRGAGQTKPLMPSEQKTGGPSKPLPAKSKPTAFYTPEGQQQIADAILTETILDLKEQADSHFDYGEYNHSVNLGRVVVQGNPRDVEAFSNAAYLLWSTGQNDTAVAFLKQGLAANPNDYYMYDELGSFFYMRLKDYPQATTYYEKATQYKCPFFTWTNLAHCYEKQDQWNKAVKAWEKATNFVTVDGLSPQASRSNNQMIQHNLARARAELARRQK